MAAQAYGYYAPDPYSTWSCSAWRPFGCASIALYRLTTGKHYGLFSFDFARRWVMMTGRIPGIASFVLTARYAPSDAAFHLWFCVALGRKVAWSGEYVA